MADPFVGEIRPFAFNYQPRGWLICNGQQVSVQQYQALYAVVGNSYGGNNQAFNLPDLQGKVPVGMGAGPGLSAWKLGDKYGNEAVALTIDQMPSHTHTANAEQDSATTPNPGGMIVAGVKSGSTGNPKFYKDAPQDQYLVPMNATTIQAVGGGQAHENRQPYQVLNFCICYDGIFPPRPQ